MSEEESFQSKWYLRSLNSCLQEVSSYCLKKRSSLQSAKLSFP